MTKFGAKDMPDRLPATAATGRGVFCAIDQAGSAKCLMARAENRGCRDPAPQLRHFENTKCASQSADAVDRLDFGAAPDCRF
jgi:hypothetical protein